MSNDPDVTAVLVTVQSEWEASLIVDALQERGIRAEAAGGLTSSFRAEAPGYARVIVPGQELEAAKAALAEIRASAAEIDWSKVDVNEPPPDDA